MGMGVQNEIVRDGNVPHCPRKPDIPARDCITKCRYCRGYLLSVSHEGSYGKGIGWQEKSKSLYLVVCEYPHMDEWVLACRKAVTCGDDK